jgi:hypothetical protein
MSFRTESLTNEVSKRRSEESPESWQKDSFYNPSGDSSHRFLRFGKKSPFGMTCNSTDKNFTFYIFNFTLKK